MIPGHVARRGRELVMFELRRLGSGHGAGPALNIQLEHQRRICVARLWWYAMVNDLALEPSSAICCVLGRKRPADVKVDLDTSSWSDEFFRSSPQPSPVYSAPSRTGYASQKKRSSPAPMSFVWSGLEHGTTRALGDIS